jgi:periplasmic divalent cation tolerance protein
MSELRWVYLTAADRDEALRVGRALVEARLAACINVLPGMTSLYWWQGAIETAQEAVLIAKTRAELIPELIERVRALHSYSVPCVLALPILEGNPDYLDWLRQETAKRSGGQAAPES